MSRVREFAAGRVFGRGDIVVVGCGRSAAGTGQGRDSRRFLVSCAGNLHSSVVEYLVRTGAGGVLVVACPPRDCWGREGPRWLVERLYREREAELQARVDRRRVRVVYASGFNEQALASARADFASELGLLDAPTREDGIAIDTECEVPGKAAAR